MLIYDSLINKNIKSNNAMYDEDDLTIDAAAFDKDFDEIAFDPIEVDDNDDEAAEIFGYN